MMWKPEKVPYSGSKLMKRREHSRPVSDFGGLIWNFKPTFFRFNVQVIIMEFFYVGVLDGN